MSFTEFVERKVYTKIITTVRFISHPLLVQIWEEIFFGWSKMGWGWRGQEFFLRIGFILTWLSNYLWYPKLIVTDLYKASKTISAISSIGSMKKDLPSMIHRLHLTFLVFDICMIRFNWWFFFLLSSIVINQILSLRVDHCN